MASFFTQYYNQQQVPLSGSQNTPVTTLDQVQGIANFGLGVGALALFGEHRFDSGKRGWDYIIQGVRAAEEYSPANVLRTFQLSHLLSPLESASRDYRYISPETIRSLRSSSAGYQWLRYSSHLIGTDLTSPEVLSQGIRFEKGRIFLGKTGSEVLLQNAGLIRAPTGALPTFQEGYARSLFGENLSSLREAFTTKIPFETATGQTLSESAIFVGGHTKAEAAKRYAFGYGTSLVERFNRLISSPGDFPGFGTFGQKIGKVLGVEPSSGLKTYGKLALKLGIGLPLAYMAYGEADWLARQIIPGGITGTLATIYTKAHVAASTFAELTGLHALREAQEEYAPGSTSLMRLAGFPLVGFMGGATLSYAQRAGGMLLSQMEGATLEEASLAGKAIEPYLINKLYGTEVPSEISRRLKPGTIDLVEKQTEKLLSGWEGKIARGIAEQQEKRGLLGGLARLLGKVTPGKIKGLIGAGIGLAAVAPFIPGALIPSKRPDELRRIYSGEQYVPIKKGRFWELSNSPFEGKRPFFAPSWYVRLMLRGQDMVTYGADLSPIGQWAKRNLTYGIEKETYWTRPYPKTSGAFEGTPFVGPLLAGTIGQVVKPTRMMHPEVWGPGGSSLPQMPLQGNEQNIVPTGMGIPGGLPISPNDPRVMISNQVDMIRDVVGLPGFALGSIKEAITGRPGVFDQEVRLASAGTMYSPVRDLYEEELGGMFGPGEILRRLFPRKQRIPEWNAIPNAFTDVGWLPGEGEFGPNVKIGDLFTQVQLGSYRLPGPVYEALHPSVKGLHPSEYPLLERFRILANVSPWSDNYHDTLAQIRTARDAGEFSPAEEEDIQRIMRQVDETKTAKTFFEYKYRSRRLPPAEEELARINENSKTMGGPISWAGSLLGAYWETLGHNMEGPLETLIPIAPAAKLIRMRTAIEDYEKTQLYGKETSFWQHPVRDFLKPFMNTVKHSAGWDSIPEEVKRQRGIEEYFDALKWIKFTRLKRLAENAGDMQTAESFESQRRSTLIGANLLNPNPTQVYRAMPRRERDYFDSFVKADLDERVQILKMVPKNEQPVYVARWLLRDAENAKKLEEKSIFGLGLFSEARKSIETLEEQRSTEGLPTSTTLHLQYWAGRQKGESYTDWYRANFLVPQATEGFNVPGPSWIGFRPEVELDDIKLKVLENMGESPEQYDIWQEEQYRTLQKPFLDDAAREIQPTLLNLGGNHNKIRQVLAARGISNTDVVTIPNNSGQFNIEMDIQEDRNRDMKTLVRKRGREMF